MKVFELDDLRVQRLDPSGSVDFCTDERGPYWSLGEGSSSRSGLKSNTARVFVHIDPQGMEIVVVFDFARKLFLLLATLAPMKSVAELVWEFGPILLFHCRESAIEEN